MPDIAMDVIRKFAPKVVLHPQDQYRPTSVEAYLKGVNIKSSKDSEFSVQATPEKLAEHSSADYYLEQHDTSVANGMPLVDGHSHAPMYVHTIDTADTVQIVYIFFYGFNGSQSGYSRLSEHEPFKTHHKNRWWTWADFAQHESDWEHVVVELEKPSLQPKRMRFARHHSADGAWLDWKHVEKSGDHPIVYSALHSHGSYPDQRGPSQSDSWWQPAGAYEFPDYLIDLVNSMPGDGPTDYSFEQVVLADQTAESVDGDSPTYWEPWIVDSLVVLTDQPWLKFAGAWAPERDNGAHIHDPSPHLPGHLHMKLSQATKLAEFVKALPKKYQHGGQPNGPSHQDWWTKQPD